MKLKNLLLIVFVMVLQIPVFTQAQTIRPLGVGDKIPDFMFAALRNTQVKGQKASDLYKSGLLIINFWATWCVPCIREMPRMNTLKTKYKGQFNMVCITNEPDATLDRFLKDKKDVDGLLFLANDKQYKQYFPHNIVPHNIWIDHLGVIKAITGDEAVKEKNIVNFLAGKTQMEMKEDDLSFDWRRPLRAEENEPLYRSILTPRKAKLGNAGVVRDPYIADKTKKIMGWNRTKTDFLWLANMKTGMQVRDWDLVEIHTLDSNSFFFPSYVKPEMSKREEGWNEKFELWANENLYCYEFSGPNYWPDSAIYAGASSDLKRFFNVETEIKNKLSDCWVICKTDKDLRLTPSVSVEEVLFQLKGTAVVAKHQTLSQLASRLSKMYAREPNFINETNIEGFFDLFNDFGDLHNQGLTIDKLRVYFNTIGLDLKKEKRQIPHLIIYDNRK